MSLCHQCRLYCRKINAALNPLVDIDDETAFFKLAKAAFAQRRKQLITITKITLKMAKHKKLILSWLNAAEIDPKRRGETLSIQDFARLYKEKKNTLN